MSYIQLTFQVDFIIIQNDHLSYPIAPPKREILPYEYSKLTPKCHPDFRQWVQSNEKLGNKMNQDVAKV